MFESARQRGEQRDTEKMEKATSHERTVEERPMAGTPKQEEDEAIPSLSWAQNMELRESFPRLFGEMQKDLKRHPPTAGGILGTQRDWTQMVNLKSFAETISLDHESARQDYYLTKDQKIQAAPPLNPEQQKKNEIQAYLHALDVLELQPGDDEDAFLEDVKDRRRRNPIAKQTARRIFVILEEARRHFPKEFTEHRVPQDQITPETAQMHPTNMLPPSNPQLQDDLLTELGTIENEQK